MRDGGQGTSSIRGMVEAPADIQSSLRTRLDVDEREEQGWLASTNFCLEIRLVPRKDRDDRRWLDVYRFRCLVTRVVPVCPCLLDRVFDASEGRGLPVVNNTGYVHL